MIKSKKVSTIVISLIMILVTVIGVPFQVSAATTVGTVKKPNSHVYDDYSITLTWSKVKGATGYQVYRYSSTKKKFVRVATTTKTKAKISNLKSNTSYRFKVRAYKTINGKNKYGKFSPERKKSTIAKTALNKKLLNGYLYAGSPQNPQLDEYVFKNDGTFAIYSYNTYVGYGTPGELVSKISGTYKVSHSIAYLTEKKYTGYEYNYTEKYSNPYVRKLYYDANKKIYRSTDYNYGGWCYTKYYYRTSKVAKSNRISYYQSHICNEIFY